MNLMDNLLLHSSYMKGNVRKTPGPNFPGVFPSLCEKSFMNFKSASVSFGRSQGSCFPTVFPIKHLDFIVFGVFLVLREKCQIKMMSDWLIV